MLVCMFVQIWRWSTGLVHGRQMVYHSTSLPALNNAFTLYFSQEQIFHWEAGLQSTSCWHCESGACVIGLLDHSFNKCFKVLLHKSNIWFPLAPTSLDYLFSFKLVFLVLGIMSDFGLDRGHTLHCALGLWFLFKSFVLASLTLFRFSM